jgi:hypothetical protein
MLLGIPLAEFLLLLLHSLTRFAPLLGTIIYHIVRRHLIACSDPQKARLFTGLVLLR